MTLLVRDEEDIVAANIDYHLSAGVDFVIATDTFRSIATPELLLEYERRGVLEYIREPSDNYAQAAWVTRMARIAHEEHDADWVINNDADEFWWPDDGSSLKDALRSIPDEYSGARVGRTNFPAWTVARPRPFFEWMTVREVSSVNTLGRPLPPKVCHRGDPSVEVHPGNHGFSLNGELARACDAPISILHFPLRSYEQFENKIVKGGEAIERNQQLPPNVCSTWRQLYREHQAGRLREAFSSAALTDDTATRRIQAGECVIDNRLRDHFARCARHEPADDT